MTPKKTLAGLSVTAILMGGVDASVLAETPLERVETIANERVEAKQIGNVVETTLPWKGELGLKVKYDMGEPTVAEKFKDKRNKEVITETVDFGDGGFKVDILLNEKPSTNVFCYQIEGAENYDFFYQPPLTAEEIAEGSSRPESIEGSYAVYHKTLKNHREGAENYATGKVMHIPRPQVWELNNQASTTEWADLSYSEQDGLCVTARQEFLDNATYPVRIDPTFGYTTLGASFVADGDTADSYRARKGTPTENGIVTTIHWGGSIIPGDTGATPCKGAIYDSSLNLLSVISDAVSVNSTTSQFWQMAVSVGLTVSSSTDYYIVTLCDNSDGDTNNTTQIARDVGGVLGDSKFGTDSAPGYDGFNDPVSLSDSSSIYSIYATYTADAPPADNFWDDM